MTKAILMLNTGGIAVSPATLCAEAPTEAQASKLPLLADALAGLTSGMNLKADGESGYRLFRGDEWVGSVEVFDLPE